MKVPIDTISIVLGAFIVLMFCLRYFNEPKYPLAFPDKEGNRMFDVALEPALPKLMTYRYRYNLFLWLFIATVEALYIVIAFYLPKFLGEPGKAMVQMGYNAIVSALIITGFLPNLGFIKALLEKTRLFFHERANIPAKGQQVFRALRSPHIDYSVEIVSALLEHPEWNHIANELPEPPIRILNERDFTSEASTPIRAKWARLTYLLFMVDIWSKKAPCSSCIGSKELGWDSIKAVHNHTKPKILAENQRSEELNTNIDILLSRTYRLIACLLFMADRSCTKLNGYLGEMVTAQTIPQFSPSPSGNWPLPPYPPDWVSPLALFWRS